MKYKDSLELHKINRGKLEVKSKVIVENKEDLSLAYTPGVALPCLEIYKNREEVYDYTIKGNSVAIITDGTAVLGLGDIGPYAALPVMEGKALLFKRFANIDAYPICLDTRDVEEIIRTVKLISPGFGGINLEDIASPRCFEIEERLKEILDIPVFHDDQHGTAIAVCAGLINALKIVGKEFNEVTIVINGAGSGGISVAKLLMQFNAFDIILVDTKGAISKLTKSSNYVKDEMALITNKFNKTGSLKEVIKNTDVFIGLSVGNVLSKEMVESMNANSIIFAMANPTPEIMPSEAKLAGARIIATGRSDYPNQINNVLVFPGIFKGALEVRAKSITEDMKVACAKAIASLVTKKELENEIIIPSVFNEKVSAEVANAVIREYNSKKGG